MNTIAEKIWKCKCVSKYAHKTKWAFVSKYKKKYSSKYDNLKILNEDTSNSLVKKLLLKKSESSQVIVVKKVRYDEKRKEIIVEEIINDKNKTNKTNKIFHNNSDILIEKDLMELKDLFNIK